MEDFKRTKLKYFSFEHLPGNLQIVSEPFYHLACSIIERSRNIDVDDQAAFFQVEMALQKLIEAKDCAVRASL